MSAVQYTDEQLNYFRVCYLTTSVIPDGLRTVFQKEWNSHFKMSHGEWQDKPKNGNDFFHLESPRNQKRNAKELAIMKRGDTDEWDCTRLFYAILHSDSVGACLNPVVRKQIEELRAFRNDVFAHSIDGQLTSAEFLVAIGKVETAFNHLMLGVSVIDEVKNQNSFPTEELSKLKQELEKEKKRNQELLPLCVLPPKPSHKTVKRPTEVKQVMENSQRLKNANSNVVTVVYLSGNPGCGKSQVARQVGESFFTNGTDKKIVFTFNASNTDTLLQSYLELADLLRCDEDRISWIETTKDLSKEEKLVKVKQLVTPRIEKYSSWLMILDNVSKLKSVSRYVPQAGDKTRAEGQVMITTQDSQYIPVDSHSYHLSLSFGLQEEDAVAALTEISDISSEEEYKRQVAKALDFQPLALACAAVYMQRIRRSKPSWKKYLGLLEQGKRKSTEKVFMESNQTYSLTMSLAVELAVTDAIKTSKVMEHTFEFLSVMAPESIALTHVVEYVKNCLADEDDDLVCSTILSSSLILCLDDETICIHQVIHSHLLAQFQKEKEETKQNILLLSINSFSNLDVDDENKRKATSILETRSTARHLEAFAKTLENNVDFNSEDIFFSTEQNLEKITICLSNMASISREHGKYSTSKLYFEFLLKLQKRLCGDNQLMLATILSNHGLLLQDLGQYDKAKTSLERALAIHQGIYDENHPKLATIMSNLGSILQSLGQYDKAKTFLERALAIQEGIYDDNHPILAITLSNLGLILKDLGQYDKAKTCLERALAIQESIYDDSHPMFATMLSNLGLILKHLEQYDKAKTCLERALAIEESIYDDNHPKIASGLSNNGLIFHDLGQYDKAKTCLERALAIQESIYDDNHPMVAISLSNLGLILKDLGEFDKAKKSLERALAIHESNYDDNHPMLTTILSNLGLIFQNLGQYDKAMTCLERALAIHESIYEENHPMLATILSNLGGILQHLGQYDKAKTCFERALAIDESIYDDKHPALATCLSNLGVILQNLGQYDEAKTCLERTLAIYESIYDGNHPIFATIMSNLGMILKDLGQYDKANTCLERALAIQESIHDDNHPILAIILSNLGQILQHLGQYDKAKTCLERATAIQESIYGNNHPTLATSLSNLGLILQDLGQYDEAKTCLERTLAIQESIYDDNHPNLAISLFNLGLILHDLEQYDKAKACLERALAIQESIYDENHPTLATFLSNLAMILQDLGQYDNAKICLERASAIKESIYNTNHLTL